MKIAITAAFAALALTACTSITSGKNMYAEQVAAGCAKLAPSQQAACLANAKYAMPNRDGSRPHSYPSNNEFPAGVLGNETPTGPG